jgi:hypothetical protein
MAEKEFGIEDPEPKKAKKKKKKVKKSTKKGKTSGKEVEMTKIGADKDTDAKGSGVV